MTNYLIHNLLGNANTGAQFAEIPGTGDAQSRYCSYGDVLQMSARFANALVERGVKPGDRVAVQVPKSIEALMLYLAAVRAGAVFLPLNTAYTKGEVAYFLNDAEPSIFVCAPERLDEYSAFTKELGIKIETLGVWTGPQVSSGSLTDAGLGAPRTFKNVDRGPEDLAAILYTSGTTGRSKGAMLSHRNLFSNAQSLTELWEFSNQDVLLHALPIFHTHGLFVATNVTLLAGASMIFLPGFDADEVVRHLPRATSMMGVPTFYTRLLDDPRFDSKLVSHMRLFISGSAPLLSETHTAFEERTGHRILERYGMTETNMNTSNPYIVEGNKGRRAGTVGFPLDDVELRICESESGKEVAPGDVGVIEVKGPNVFSGYWKMPDKTAEEFREDGFFITGDLGKIDPDGYVHIVGRAKDLIISGGYNIYPKEVELLLDEQEGILESAVVGVPHPDFGEGVIAVVVPSTPEFDPVATLSLIKPQIARYKQPKLLHVMDELPRNTMGKVQKNVLRELLHDSFSG